MQHVAVVVADRSVVVDGVARTVGMPPVPDGLESVQWDGENLSLQYGNTCSTLPDDGSFIAPFVAAWEQAASAGPAVPTPESDTPLGTVMQYAATMLPPGGRWLWCDGATIGKPGSGARHTHADLKAAFDLLKWNEPNKGGESWDAGDLVRLPTARAIEPTDDHGSDEPAPLRRYIIRVR